MLVLALKFLVVWPGTPQLWLRIMVMHSSRCLICLRRRKEEKKSLEEGIFKSKLGEVWETPSEVWKHTGAMT